MLPMLSSSIRYDGNVGSMGLQFWYESGSLQQEHGRRLAPERLRLRLFLSLALQREMLVEARPPISSITALESPTPGMGGDQRQGPKLKF